MKIIDIRDQTTMEGVCVAVLKADQPVSEADMLRFYGLKPDHRAFDLLATACPQDRLVLQRGEPEDRHYYIVPKYPFYRIEE